MIRNTLISTLFASLVALSAQADSVAGLPGQDGLLRLADRIVVKKSERRMELYREGHVIASYRVSLGLNPNGHKQREGDFRTPEGSYRLTRRNAESEFFLAVQVSYPEAADIKLARKYGWSPGGLIMVHGLPNVPKYPRDRYLNTDWTDGCIALSNEDMLDFWLLTGQGTPIEITP
ncbi:MAG: L,D-transpeptidase family protein [Sphingomonadaceae bacterium]